MKIKINKTIKIKENDINKMYVSSQTDEGKKKENKLPISGIREVTLPQILQVLKEKFKTLQTSLVNKFQNLD